MRAFVKFIGLLLVIALLVAAVAWFWAGRSAGPTITIRQPGAFVGQNSSLEMMVDAPGGKFSAIDATVEQGGKTFPVFTLAQPQGDIRQESAERLYVMRPMGKRALPELQPGPARLVVRAARPVLYGLRDVSSTTAQELTVRLDPPQVSVLSTFHYVNHGGSELVIYRASPPDVESGVRVGNVEYRGYPATGVGITTDPALRVAFFALLFEQDLNTDFHIFARDPAGNESVVSFDHQVFPKPYSKSRIEIDDRFIGRVVPAIASTSPQEKIPTDDLVAGFLKINGDLRVKNNQFLTELAKKSAPQMLFKGPFQQLGNSQVEARFADTRTYVYKGKEIDRQVHLGFDLAVTANVPVVAAERGIIVHASDLGIYGNCVVIDHGLGVQSLYGHLSSIGVKVGDQVEKGGQIGRSGMTGLAGGDHLHFTMLVGGQQVTPVDWWSVKWFEDRVHRKIVAAGGV